VFADCLIYDPADTDVRRTHGQPENKIPLPAISRRKNKNRLTESTFVLFHKQDIYAYD